MPLIRPFCALRPAPGRAPDIIAPPYDVVNTEEARELVRDRPWSFLHISKPEVDLPCETDVHAPEVYATAAKNLQRMRSAGVLTQDEEACYYAYRLVMGDHIQVGIVVSANVAHYSTNRIRRHEFTRPDKEDDRVRQIEAVCAQTGPVLLAHPDAPKVEQILDRAVAGAPDADASDGGGVRHTIWAIRDAETIAELTRCFELMPALYIADGHHRAAAAARIAAARRAANPHHDGNEEYNYFLAVIYPARRMKILDYNRVVRDLNGLHEAAFLSRIARDFEVIAASEVVHPQRAGEFGLYLKSGWKRLRIRDDLIPDDPVRRLDVSLLQDHLIAPVLGIADPRRDQRIDFVGGIRGLGELERRVNAGEMAVAFALHPTSMKDLMAVADAGEVMPPKSTWFEPKLADGLASHLI